MRIRKRNGQLTDYNPAKIFSAIANAVKAVEGTDLDRVQYLVDLIHNDLKKSGQEIVEIESIQDLVEKTLVEQGHYKTAKAYMLYREKRKAARELNALTGATINMYNDYIDREDWEIKENANQSYSIAGFHNYSREKFTKLYQLSELYPVEVANAHKNGDVHIHDLGFLGPYCAGWDIKQLLMEGFGGVDGKVQSKPAKHLRSLLGQIINSTFTTQGECAGAQAWSGFDTYLAPFIRYDGLDYKQVKQCIQEFIFNMNVPTRVGFQCPFSNLTFDITAPKALKDTPVIVGGKYTNDIYGDFQDEMDMLNKAFCEVMFEGDAKGRAFTFPIPTINISSVGDIDNPSIGEFMKLSCKYGTPYFANYINSDLSAEDAVSMCCRLRLDKNELRKRGGGLFGSNPLTGSIGVVTINLPRIFYKAERIQDIYDKLSDLTELAVRSLEIKRSLIEKLTDKGLYPYSKSYLKDIKKRTGEYWFNHFGTIGIIGMNEALLNLIKQDISTDLGRNFAVDILNRLRDLLTEHQERTGHVYNLEASPAEGASYKLANLDTKKYPDIITAGETEHYYTNSTQLPSDYNGDLFDILDNQDKLQSLYTGGTVQHIYIGEAVEDVETLKGFLRNTFTHYKIPYISITPTFSICSNHGYLSGEHFTCPDCGIETEVWSRVTGYLRPVSSFNKGKKDEYKLRVKQRI
jgi:anaerobic ribonucleoside-triphosphate reductase